jgi:hypothetical protein
MNEHLGEDARPGMGPVVVQTAALVLKNESWFITRGVVIPSDAEDAGNTPVTKLRAGLVLVRVEAGGDNQGKYVPVDHDDAPVHGAVAHAAILMKPVNMIGRDGSTVEEMSAPALIAGWIDEDHVIIVDEDYRDDVKRVLPLCYFEAAP